MSDTIKETLSALMDGEASELELRRILKESEGDQSVLDTWSRYHLVQSVLHHESKQAPKGLSQKIADQLEVEHFDAALTSNSPWSEWQNHVAKFAIAATVALAIFVTLQTNLNNVDVGSNLVADDSALNTSPSSQQPVLVETASFTVDPQAEQVLREYIERIYVEVPEVQRVNMEHIQDSPLYRVVNEYSNTVRTPDPR